MATRMCLRLLAKLVAARRLERRPAFAINEPLPEHSQPDTEQGDSPREFLPR